MTHILIIVPQSTYESMPQDQQSNLMDMIRQYLIDKTCNPMSGPVMMRGTDPVIVGAYWREHCTADLTTEVIEAINIQLSPIGVMVVECDDIQAKLAELGITQIQGDVL